MVNYKLGKIYSIRSYQTDMIYIGSTTQPLSKRLNGHRQHYKYFQRGIHKVNLSSFEILKYDDAYIELIKDCPCETKEQLYRSEGLTIRTMDNVVNKIIPGRSHKEYYAENREEVRLNCKKYYQENKEALCTKATIYREKNKETIAAKNSVKVECDLCGKIISHVYLSRHKRYSCKNNPDKLKASCTHCGKEMLPNSIYRHMKKCLSIPPPAYEEAIKHQEP